MSNAQDPLLVANESNPTMQNKHIKKIVVSGVGFFSDAYDLFIINIVLVILARDFSMTSEDKSLVSAAALWGAVMGQLGFGLVADKIGRKKGFIVTLSMVIIGAILSALSFETSSASVFVSLSIFRLFLGIGIGGEYPLSATITAESSHHSNRGRMTALVFSMQGVGSLVASIVGFSLLIGMLDTHLPEKAPENVHALNLVWRLALGFGAIPGILSLYFRVTMEETEKFLASQSATSEYSTYTLKDKIIIHLKDTYASIKPHWKSLIGTAGSWFLFDIVFYANGLFSATVLEIFDVNGGTETPDVLLTTAKFNIFLALIALPGYWVGVWLIELPLFGRKNTQIFGLIALTINYIGVGLAFDFLKRHPALFIAFYGLTFFLCNAGPNTTTFVLPSESFPTESRATCHGISAAAGKVGAVVGASMMAPILSSHGVPTVLYICGVVSFFGAICTYFFIKETRGLSLEEVTNTDSSSAEAPASPSYSTMNHHVPLENH